jgi:shikimate kinase
MGAGKSTIGKRLANKMDLPFIDIDDAFEEKFRFSIPRFFEQFGEEKFREFESILLKEIIDYNENVIISTGGGTACHTENIELINNSGISIYLEMSPASIAHRLKNARKLRPVIMEIRNEDMLDFIKEQLDHRKAYYHQAHITVKAENMKLDYLIGKITEMETYNQ